MMACAALHTQGYAHLFNIQGSASPTPGSSAAGVSGGDAGAQLAQLPGAFSDKFEGHVMVPIDLWLQAYKEGQVRVCGGGGWRMDCASMGAHSPHEAPTCERSRGQYASLPWFSGMSVKS
jgi:hypothetical protein